MANEVLYRNSLRVWKVSNTWKTIVPYDNLEHVIKVSYDANGGAIVLQYISCKSHKKLKMRLDRRINPPSYPRPWALLVVKIQRGGVSFCPRGVFGSVERQRAATAPKAPGSTEE